MGIRERSAWIECIDKFARDNDLPIQVVELMKEAVIKHDQTLSQTLRAMKLLYYIEVRKNARIKAHKTQDGETISTQNW